MLTPERAEELRKALSDPSNDLCQKYNRWKNQAMTKLIFELAAFDAQPANCVPRLQMTTKDPDAQALGFSMGCSTQLMEMLDYDSQTENKPEPEATYGEDDEK